jgi:hypothetical protein
MGGSAAGAARPWRQGPPPPPGAAFPGAAAGPAAKSDMNVQTLLKQRQ